MIIYNYQDEIAVNTEMRTTMIALRFNDYFINQLYLSVSLQRKLISFIERCANAHMQQKASTVRTHVHTYTRYVSLNDARMRTCSKRRVPCARTYTRLYTYACTSPQKIKKTGVFQFASGATTNHNNETGAKNNSCCYVVNFVEA